MALEELKILIVEDNPGDLFLVKEFLKRTSLRAFEIFHADSLEKALLLLSENSFKIVLLDLFLPDSEGIGTFEKIYPLSGSAPVVVLTGLIDEKITSEALNKGAQDYLVKGEYDKKLLEKTIRYSIERKQNQELLKQSEEEYKLLFESNPIPMWAYDVESLKIATVNEAAILYYGYSRDEFLNLTLVDILPKEGVIELQQNPAFRKTRAWRHKRKDNTIIYVEILSHDLT